MALQYSEAIRNAQLDAVESTIGASAILRIYESTGTPPADVATAVNGTMLVEMNLPADWMAAAASGSKAKSGTWQDASANASGTADYFRIYASDGTTAGLQGTVGLGSGDLQLDNNVIAATQQVTVTSFTLNAGNA